MDIISQSAFLKALGWALLNSLWQFGLLWLVFVFIFGHKKASPLLKHSVALLFMTGGFVWFAAGLYVQYFAPPAGTGFIPNLGGDQSVYAGAYTLTQQFLEANLSYVSGVYLLVVAVLLFQLVLYFYRSHALRTKGLYTISPALQQCVYDLVHQLRIRRKVMVWVSQYIDTPMVMGFITPTILLPLASINQLSVKQMEAIILHELSHIKRNDYLVNVLVVIINILFFFNPFCRLLIGAIKEERENSCDDRVLQFQFDPFQYAAALLVLEKSRSEDNNPGIAATGESSNILLHRIQRIMKVNKTGGQHGIALIGYVLVIGLISFIALVHPGKANLNNRNNQKAISGPSVKSLQEVNPLFVSYGNHHPVSASKHAPMPTATKPVLANDVEDSNNPLAVNVDTDLEDQANAFFAAAVQADEKDFSIVENPQPVLPAAASLNNIPYVPTSSFIYHDLTDTLKPTIQVQTDDEQSARALLAKAKLAIDNLDWKKLEKQLSGNKLSVERLKMEFENSLKSLNWQRINQEVNEKLHQEDLAKMRASLKVEYDHLNEYKSQEQEYIRLRKELLQQQEKYKISNENNRIDIQKAILSAKKVIIHI